MRRCCEFFDKLKVAERTRNRKLGGNFGPGKKRDQPPPPPPQRPRRPLCHPPPHPFLGREPLPLLSVQAIPPRHLLKHHFPFPSPRTEKKRNVRQGKSIHILVARITRPTVLAIWHRGCSHCMPNHRESPHRRHFACLVVKTHADISRRRPTSQEFRRSFSGIFPVISEQDKGFSRR